MHRASDLSLGWPWTIPLMATLPNVGGVSLRYEPAGWAVGLRDGAVGPSPFRLDNPPTNMTREGGRAVAVTDPDAAGHIRPIVVSAEGREWSPFAPLLLAGAAETGGRIEVYEISQRRMEQGVPGPPPHVHQHHEEAFYILEGRFTFTLGTVEAPAPAGTLVVVPRGTRHAFRMEPGSRCVVFAIPGGLAGFFEELTAARAAGGLDADVRAVLARKYDSTPDPG